MFHIMWSDASRSSAGDMKRQGDHQKHQIQLEDTNFNQVSVNTPAGRRHHANDCPRFIWVFWPMSKSQKHLVNCQLRSASRTAREQPLNLSSHSKLLQRKSLEEASRSWRPLSHLDRLEHIQPIKSNINRETVNASWPLYCIPEVWTWVKWLGLESDLNHKIDDYSLYLTKSNINSQQLNNSLDSLCLNSIQLSSRRETWRTDVTLLSDSLKKSRQR